MITSLHSKILFQQDQGNLRIVQSRGPIGIVWSAYDPERPFQMKVGASKAEALAKWFAANPVSAAA